MRSSSLFESKVLPCGASMVYVEELVIMAWGFYLILGHLDP